MAFESFFVFCPCGDKFISVPKGSKCMDHARSMRFLRNTKRPTAALQMKWRCARNYVQKNKSQ